MNWEAIGALGEVAGALAVVGSLFYLGRQIRANSIAVRADSYQSLALAAMEANSQIMQDPVIVDLVTRAISGEPLDEAERRRYMVLVMNFLRLAEVAHHQVTHRILDAGNLRSLTVNVATHLGSPEGTRIWQGVRGRYPEPFQRFIDESVSCRDDESLLQLFAREPATAAQP